jgi:hypothetical protein
MNDYNKEIILYRGLDFEKEELAEASKHFTCTNRRPDIKKGDLVIGRYSLLPFYADQAKDVEYVGARLINSYNEHLYIADLQNYVYDLQELTPRTWRDLHSIPDNMSFVLKGETNSRKSSWKRDMFAANKKEAIEVYGRLSDDSLIGQQKIYIREYVPLIKYMDGINGMPVTKEFRFFVAFGQILCGAYYWQNYIDDLVEMPDVNEVPLDLLHKVISRVDNQCNFFTIDVGQTQTGEWIVIELNDGQQAGLSCNAPEVLYERLRVVINERKNIIG